MKKILSMILLIIMCFIATPVFATQVTCGNIEGMPGILPIIFHSFVVIMKIVVPVIIIIKGMIDFTTVVTSSKDDAMGSALKKFLKRLIYGALVFLIVSIVQLVVRIGTDDKDGEDSVARSATIDCMDCFINNNCSKK